MKDDSDFAKMSSFDIDKYIVGLLRNEPFFAAVSRRIEKISTTSVPTAGVRVNPETGYFEMFYNPNFFANLFSRRDKNESIVNSKLVGVIVHEYYHIILRHVTSRIPQELRGIMGKPAKDVPLELQQNFKFWNFATDLAINSIIGLERLPEECLYPGKEPFKDWPAHKTADWYYARCLSERERLLKDTGGDCQNGDGDGNCSGIPRGHGGFDDHSEWSTSKNSGGNDDEASEIASAAAEVAEQRLKDIMSRAATEATLGGGWGSAHAYKDEILDFITSKINWRSVLRYFIKTSQRSNKQSTIRRLNKKYPYIHPGKKNTHVANIAISIDQSGSVSNEMLVSFFSELNSLSKLATFTVIPFDHDIAEDRIFVWKKGMSHSPKRVLYGGTNFTPPTKYVNEHNFDGHIILTDMCAPAPISSKCQRMWMTDKSCAKQKYFVTKDRVITID